MPGDESVQKLHEDILQRNINDIHEIKKELATITTLQEKFSNMEGWLKRISADIKEFIDKSDNKFQTKEMCEVCMQTSDKQYTELARAYENRVTDLKETYVAAINELKQNHKEEIKDLQKKMWEAVIVILGGVSVVAWAFIKVKFGV